MTYFIIVVLVTLSGLFSGLTLGLLSLDTQSLQRRASLGDRNAQKIYPLRAKGNQLLTTLLLGNVAVNTTLSVFLGSITSGVVAALTATAIIVIFGEIVPQAVISRYALWFGAKTAWFTKLMLILLYPIAYPIGAILDHWLGAELPSYYTRQELMAIISEHEDSEHSTIDADEERILHGALRFSHLHVDEVMTPLSEVVMFEEQMILNKTLLEDMNSAGYSRYPIYRKIQDRIIGMLYVKDLIIEQNDIAIKDTKEAFEDSFMTVQEKDYLDTVLKRMLRRKQHLAVVQNREKKSVGVLSLEDILEEIIQQEILDEDDEDVFATAGNDSSDKS